MAWSDNLRDVPIELGEAVLRDFIALFGPEVETAKRRCNRCLKEFTYRAHKNGSAPKYCLNCVRY